MTSDSVSIRYNQNMSFLDRFKKEEKITLKQLQDGMHKISAAVIMNDEEWDPVDRTVRTVEIAGIRAQVTPYSTHPDHEASVPAEISYEGDEYIIKLTMDDGPYRPARLEAYSVKGLFLDDMMGMATVNEDGSLNEPVGVFKNEPEVVKTLFKAINQEGIRLTNAELVAREQRRGGAHVPPPTLQPIETAAPTFEAADDMRPDNMEI
jgi:hypothetical protein